MAAVLRVLLFALIIALALVLEGVIIVAAVLLRGAHIAIHRSTFTVLRAPQYIAVEALVVVALVVAMLVMARIERRTLADYGFPFRRLFGRPLWNGLATGALAASIVIAAMFACGTARIHGSGAGSATRNRH
jgi:hypothetical protein